MSRIRSSGCRILARIRWPAQKRHQNQELGQKLKSGLKVSEFDQMLARKPGRSVQTQEPVAVVVGQQSFGQTQGPVQKHSKKTAARIQSRGSPGLLLFAGVGWRMFVARKSAGKD